MTAKKIKGACTAAKKAVQELKEALEILKTRKDPRDMALAEDGAVKRFETLFEYSWKALKAAAEFEGSEAPGPRPAIQEAIKFGWIKNVDIWLAALDTRNATVHDYFDAAPDDYMRVIEEFTKEAMSVLEIISTIGVPSNKHRNRTVRHS